MHPYPTYSEIGMARAANTVVGGVGLDPRVLMMMTTRTVAKVLVSRTVRSTCTRAPTHLSLPSITDRRTVTKLVAFLVCFFCFCFFLLARVAVCAIVHACSKSTVEVE